MSENYYEKVLGTYENEIYIFCRPRKKKSKPKYDPLKGTNLDYCLYCQCFYQHRISAQHQRTSKHCRNYKNFGRI